MIGRGLQSECREFQRVMSGLLKQYQFRDRSETVAYGLSVSQAYALRALSEGGGLTMGTLAGELYLSVSAATRVVDSLVERRLVRRTQDPFDRRVWRVEMSARGRALWRRLEDELLEIDAGVLSRLSPTERRALIRAIAQLSQATTEWRARQAARQPTS